jgi:hypothetical protein
MSCISAASLSAAAALDRLVELETALENQMNATRFYTPSAPIIGLNATCDVNLHSAPHQGQHQQSQVFEEQDQDEIVCSDDDMVDEYQDVLSGSELMDRMDELEDSTGSPY